MFHQQRDVGLCQAPPAAPPELSPPTIQQSVPAGIAACSGKGCHPQRRVPRQGGLRMCCRGAAGPGLREGVLAPPPAAAPPVPSTGPRESSVPQGSQPGGESGRRERGQGSRNSHSSGAAAASVSRELLCQGTSPKSYSGATAAVAEGELTQLRCCGEQVPNSSSLLVPLPGLSPLLVPLPGLSPCHSLGAVPTWPRGGCVGAPAVPELLAGQCQALPEWSSCTRASVGLGGLSCPCPVPDPPPPKV